MILSSLDQGTHMIKYEELSFQLHYQDHSKCFQFVNEPSHCLISKMQTLPLDSILSCSYWRMLHYYGDLFYFINKVTSYYFHLDYPQSWESHNFLERFTHSHKYWHFSISLLLLQNTTHILSVVWMKFWAFYWTWYLGQSFMVFDFFKNS